jgi:pSer/pThr/pTyr-binding forkhead associated (FHA) protein
MSERLLRRSTATVAAELPATPSMRIGSGADAEVRVDGPGVRPIHATLTREGDRLVLTGSAEAGAAVWLNGRRVSREALQHLDVITLAPDVDLIYLAR